MDLRGILNTTSVAFLPGETVPDEFWRKIELRYPDHRVITMLYDTEPPADELPEVMWQLQRMAAIASFRVFVTTQDRKTVEAPPIKEKKRAAKS